MADSHIWLQSPDGAKWACPAPAVGYYEARDWVQCDAPDPDDSHLYDPKPPAPQPAPAPAPEPTKKAAPRGQNTPEEK